MQDTISRPSSRRHRRLGVALVSATLLVLTGCGGTEAEPAGDGAPDVGLIDSGTLVAASSGEYRPFSFFEGDALVGFDKDVADAVAEEMGLESQTETGQFDTLIQGLQTNRYDVIIGSMTPTEKREEAVDFTDGYYTSGAQTFVRGDSECTDPTELADATVGVASGTTYEEFLDAQDWATDVKTYGSDVTALGDLAAGRLDGVVTDKLVGLNQIEEAEQDLKTCGELLYSEEPAFAVKKGNEDLVAALDEALATVRENGTYAEISEKWFGQDIS